MSDDPLILEENRQEAMIKQFKHIEADEWTKEKLKVDMEFFRKPLWMQAREEGDRMQDGSDEQEYSNEEERIAS